MDNKSQWACDFETTTEADYKVDGYVRVFLWHARELFGPGEAMGYDIDSFIEWARNAKSVWFHNLRFDGSYILNRLLETGWEWSEKQVRGKRTYDHIVTDQGQWMQLVLRYGDHVTKIKDSAKKFPGFSLERLSKIYGIEGKSSLYLGYRGPDYIVTEEDIERVKGDTRILKVAMEHVLSEGMTRLTMASDALADFQERFGIHEYRFHFPKLPHAVDEFVRAAYKGGWTWCNPRWQERDLRNVYVYDVNSMYPSVMRQYELPYGKPYIRSKPDPGELYVVRFSCAYKLKPGKFPMIQLKGSYLRAQAEYAVESDGLETLTLTSVDYDLFHECYDVSFEKIEQYMCFKSKRGMFDDYIDHWGAEKVRCSDAGDKAGKETAKRMLNSLYGRFGMRQERASKRAHLEDGVIRWHTVQDMCDGAYVPMAAFITAYARRKILDMAHAFGDDFVYADTDSVHVLCTGEGKDIDVDDSRLGAWKLESHSERARYLRPKTYIHAYADGSVEDVKCAGMPEACKANVTWENFHGGARYKGKLIGKQVRGGYCLIDTTYNVSIGTYRAVIEGMDDDEEPAEAMV